MKRLITLTVLFLILGMSPVSAWKIKNEPLGWNGWAWGTPLSEMAGQLIFRGLLNEQLPIPIDNEALIFAKGDAPITFANWKWEEFYCIFSNQKFVGILFQETRHSGAILYAFSYLTLNISDDTQDMINTTNWGARLAKGTFASAIYFYIPDDDSSYEKFEISWIVGMPQVVDKWIETINQAYKK